MDVGDVSMAATAVTSEHEITGAADGAHTSTERARPTRTQGYRAGIIGSGFMGRVHAHAIRANGGEVVAVVGSGRDGSAAAAAALRPSTGIDDLAAMLANDLIDVVHVCTPNHLHAPMAAAALRAGKHVVCEKPLATDAPDAIQLVDLAEQLGLVATIPFVYRFHPMVREARERIRAGRLGRVNLAHGSYLQDWLVQPTDDNWRIDAAKGGATRAFGDIGVHWFDLFEFVTGDRVRSVSAQLVTTVPNRGATDRVVATEDIATVSFDTVGGIVGTAVISQVAPGRKNRLLLEISGSDATVSFDQEQPELLWVGGREANQLLVRDPAVASPAAAPYSRLPAGHAQGYQDCFDSFVDDTAAAIAGHDVDGLPTFDAGLRAARLAEAVLRSAAERCWIEVEG